MDSERTQGPRECLSSMAGITRKRNWGKGREAQRLKVWGGGGGVRSALKPGLSNR